jgi:hypothetical protein
MQQFILTNLYLMKMYQFNFITLLYVLIEYLLYVLIEFISSQTGPHRDKQKLCLEIRSTTSGCGQEEIKVWSPQQELDTPPPPRIVVIL